METPAPEETADMVVVVAMGKDEVRGPGGIANLSETPGLPRGSEGELPLTERGSRGDPWNRPLTGWKNGVNGRPLDEVNSITLLNMR